MFSFSSLHQCILFFPTVYYLLHTHVHPDHSGNCNPLNLNNSCALHSHTKNQHVRPIFGCISHLHAVIMKYEFTISALKSCHLPTPLYCVFSHCCLYHKYSKLIFPHEEFLVYFSKHQPVYISYGETNSPVVTYKSGCY